MTTKIDKKAEAKTKTPTLTCIVTGVTRISNKEYLDKKPTNFASHYIRREAMVLLREGKTYIQVREALGSTLTDEISDRKMKEAMKLNGKQKHIQPQPEPKAPAKAKSKKQKKAMEIKPEDVTIETKAEEAKVEAPVEAQPEVVA